MALGTEEAFPELDVYIVKDLILLSTWFDAEVEPVGVAVHITLGGCVITGAEVYAGGSEWFSEW